MTSSSCWSGAARRGWAKRKHTPDEAAGYLLATLLPFTAVPAQTVTVRADVTPVAYRTHLAALRTVVAECVHQPTAETCAGSRVGADDRVQLGPNARKVSYDWLRQALDEAAKDTAARAQLKDADKRLAEAIDAPDTPHLSPPKATRARLDKILAGGEFVHVHQSHPFASAWNRLLRWLFRRLGGAVGNGGQWLGRAFWLVLLALGIGGLLWWFARQVRRQGLAVREPVPARAAAGEPLAWEAWSLAADAHARSGAWRQAIHATYWAAASRLAAELRWPGNPARTPRETLGLVDPASPRRGIFSLLTRRFEQTWYGNRVASAEDFDRARDLFVQLDPRT